MNIIVVSKKDKKPCIVKEIALCYKTCVISSIFEFKIYDANDLKEYVDCCHLERLFEEYYVEPMASKNLIRAIEENATIYAKQLDEDYDGKYPIKKE